MTRTGDPTSRTLDERVAGIEGAFESNASRLDKIDRTLERISEQLSAVRMPNVSTWIAAAGVAVAVSALFASVSFTIGGVVMAGFSREIGDMKAYFRERADANTISVRDLDTALQREMRLLDDAMALQIEALDKRLQHEMVLMLESSRLDRRGEILELKAEMLERKIRELEGMP
jgi:hypothetical protein